MTLQDVFDRVARHLLAQGKRSMRLNDRDKLSCAYRGDDGLRCAAGALLDDERYASDMEGTTIGGRRVWEAIVASGVPASAFDLVEDLQHLHDRVEPRYWRIELHEVAGRFDLSIEALQ